MRLIMKSSTLFTLLALAGGTFSAWRSGDASAGAPVVVAVIVVAVAAGFGVAKLNDVIALALARRRGGGSLDNAPAVARWWWVAATIAGSLAVSQTLTGNFGWALFVFVPCSWLVMGAIGSWVLLRRPRQPHACTEHPA